MQKPGVANPRARREKRAVERARHLFVDGYNILHAWQWLTPRTSDASSAATARERLIETVRVLHDVDHLRVTIVFDGRGATVAVDAATAEPGFDVVFAPVDRTADTIIEAGVAAALDPQACLVATADQLERETVTASGATCVSPEDLLAWCERSRARAAQTVARRAEKSRGNWGNKLPL